MHDIKWIRENPGKFDEALTKRNIEPLSESVLALDEEKRRVITELQNLQELRNKKAKEISMFADKKSAQFKELLKAAEELKQQLVELESATNDGDKLASLLETLPNIPADNVPIGKDEEANIEVSRWGTPRSYDFNPLEHFDLGEKLGMMDFEQTAKISGSRFVSLKGDLAKLERALMNFMLDIHTKEFGYEEATVPHLVRDSAMYGVGQLPKFAEDSFATTNGYRLIPTAEVSLTNFVADKVLDESMLPLRYTAFSYCFRSEAGSAGRDTRGMIRLHQFSKVELVSITKPEDSEKEHERMLSAAEEVLRRLELPYRVMLLSSGDMGFSATKTYDLEVWLPGQNKYREISSCSNCGDFQARRMKARYKNIAGENIFVHTLNGSGLAVGRTIVAILENYQNEDGSITVPHSLIPYFGKEKIC